MQVLEPALEPGLQPLAEKKDEAVLSVRNVSKKFCKRLKDNMIYGMTDLFGSVLGLKPDTSRLRKGEVWALQDVSFELKKGQILGIIGPNGSGKTTLLRLITGILPPDKGEIITRGRVGALISLGAGFHPHLTGRENIYLNGTIMGMTRKQIDEKIQSIIDFSGLKDFIEAPVASYSSGMRVRLGFSIAVAIQPDLLILDEVLAVGDRNFKAKCYAKIDQFSKTSGIVLVSHSIQKIARICTEIMVLQEGKNDCFTKDVPAGVNYYYSKMETEKCRVLGKGRAHLHHVLLSSPTHSNSEKNGFTLDYLEDLKMEILLSLDPSVKRAGIKIDFLDKDLDDVASCSSFSHDFMIENNADLIPLSVKFPRLQLNPGRYYFSVTIRDEKQWEPLAHYHALKHFHVKGPYVGTAPFLLQAEWSCEEAKP